MAATWTSTGARSVKSTQALSEAAPVAAADGLALDDVGAVQPILHAPAGQTITGGTLLGYIYTGSAWVRAPRADYDLSAVVGLQDSALPSTIVDAPRGRFALIASGITLSGAGTTVTIDFLCISHGVPLRSTL